MIVITKDAVYGPYKSISFGGDRLIVDGGAELQFTVIGPYTIEDDDFTVNPETSVDKKKAR